MDLKVSYLDLFGQLAVAEVGRLVMAALEYEKTGVEPTFIGNERFAWPALKIAIDEGRAKPATKAAAKPPKKAYGEMGICMLTEEEHKRLEERIGDKATKEYIDRIEEYVASTGTKYQSHYATILAWWRKAGCVVERYPAQRKIAADGKAFEDKSVEEIFG